MSVALSPREIRNKNKARLWTMLWAVLLLILLVLPMLTYQDPPPGQEGILVNLGLPDQGEGDENAGPSQPQPAREEPQEPRESQEQVEPEPEDEMTEKEVVTTEDPDAVALEKAREEQARKEQEAREQARKEAEARRKAEEEAARKQAEANELKDQLGGLFGTGEGKGETSTKGNQGDPEGDPNADRLKGISTGPGELGGGLGGRGVLSAPEFNDDTQVQGAVTIKVCVNENGEVTSAKFSTTGTTISDGSLIKKAEENARKWKFTPGKRACGTIKYDLKIKK